MTEKDSLEEVKETPQEEVEIEEKEQAPDTEKESDFLVQWKERHQAYLVSQKEGDAEETASSTSDSEKTESDISKLKKKARKASFSPHTKKESSASSAQDVDTHTKKVRVPIPREAVLKSLLILLLALAGILLSSYFISPLSKEKRIDVVGTKRLTAKDILTYSQISARDYALTTLLSKKQIEQNIKNSSNLVKSNTIAFQFPNRFTIEVEEYEEVGYLKEKNAYRLVLTSGTISEIAIAEEELPEEHTLINLKDHGLVKELALQLATIDQAITRNIQSVDLTPSKSTADLLTLTMYDGHKVLIPLSEIKRKLPYYSKIAEQLSVPSMIDMEVGIFSYAI
ncbi:cell division protein FtsQ/DivIB [Streptococcus marmotae]|uniref:cell division protein FtsQ/DivIB n=1 Tax=Streptococcus marmotae TaxID=1825069 RepID=UPI0008344636|nr:FtsQ-type POTRA domain-containing protein [Streptococcus marmotae]